MEQRIGSKSQPLDAAAVNPAYIPGLTSPVPAEPEGAAEEPAEAVAEETPSATASAPAAPGDAESGATAADAVEEAGAAESAPDPEGPVFEASDRRASIRADHGGVRLRLDDQEAEFRWDEIGAVETASPRFGKRFTVTVHTPDSRWYPIEIEAASRSRFAEWEEQLDAVLDRYFEDDDAEAGASTEAEDDGGRDEPEAEAEDTAAGEPAAPEESADAAAEEPAGRSAQPRAAGTAESTDAAGEAEGR
ncbi:hypothetical protein ACGFS9_19265 [Streptomyces sp. NPDC048566]|uniref:hypothetical protein n=1 Tax=Streptomyces sp. NPDC048566 TaxID=3365569 RepID=UPI00371246DC